jgi:hypothetical protein
MTVRTLLAALAVTLLLATAAGCGAAQEAGDAASLAPASAKALAEIDGDLDSDQWQATRTLLSRFPDGGKLFDELPELGEAIGDQIVVVALSDEKGLALTQPDDAGKLRSLVSEYHLVSREIEGWTAVAEDAATLDAYERALEGGTLDGDETYEAARSALPDDSLATLYARGETKAEWTALALTAEDDGFRLAGRIKTASADGLEAVDPGALSQVPGDALAVLAFGGGDFLSELPDTLGIDLAPIEDALSGGAVVWVRPGAPIPEVTAVLPNADAVTLDLLAMAFTGSTPEDTELEGQPAKRIAAGPVTITYADIDGRLVLTTGGSLGGTGQVGDIPGVQEGREKVGIEARGLVYVDVQRVASLLSLLGGLGEVPPELTRNLEHVDWLYAAYGGDGSEQEIGLFLAIR